VTRLGRLARCAGIVLVGAGALVLAFWCYLQWGTGIAEHRAQVRLGTELSQRHPEVPGSRGTPSHPTPYRWPALPDGAALARLVIPAIALDQVVVQGTDTADLEEGPGHYPGTPYPGQPGNVAIAGHRTTYARPFLDLDHLVPGDLIELSVPGVTWDYRVVGSIVVSPDDVAVAGPLGEPGAWLTLTTCNPRYSAATRLVVRAELSSSPAMAPTPPAPPVPSTGPTSARPLASLGRGATASPVTSSAASSALSTGWPIAGWALALIGVFAVGLLMLRRVGRLPARMAVAAVSAAGVLVVLFELFGAVANHLPAGY